MPDSKSPERTTRHGSVSSRKEQRRIMSPPKEVSSICGVHVNEALVSIDVDDPPTMTKHDRELFDSAHRHAKQLCAEASTQALVHDRKKRADSVTPQYVVR